MGCDICGNWRKIERGLYCLLGDQTFRIVKCKQCGLIYVTPRPELSFLISLYGKEYFRSGYTGFIERNEEYIKQRLNGPAGLRTVLKELEPVKRHNCRLLEVGCADGFFLQLAKSQGWEPYGVDISPYAVSYARKGRGLTIREGTLEEQIFPSGFFGAAYLGDVLAHTPSPFLLLKEVHRTMAKGGVLFVTSPAPFNGALAKVQEVVRNLRKSHLDNLEFFPNSAHFLYWFSPRTLRSVLVKSNFVVLKLQVYAPVNSLSFIGNILDGAGQFLLGNLFQIGSRMTALARVAD